MPELPTDIQFALDEIKRRLAAEGISIVNFGSYKQKFAEQHKQEKKGSETK